MNNLFKKSWYLLKQWQTMTHLQKVLLIFHFLYKLTLIVLAIAMGAYAIIATLAAIYFLFTM